jgi:Ca-activated chloride channel family protein
LGRVQFQEKFMLTRAGTLLSASAVLAGIAVPAAAENACVARYLQPIVVKTRPHSGYAPVAPPPVRMARPDVRSRDQDAGKKMRRSEHIAQVPSAVTPPPVGRVAPNLALGAPHPDQPPPPDRVQNRDKFPDLKANKPNLTAEAPLSTFGADVDTASYTLISRLLREGQPVRPEAVRVEEFVNAFAYDYAAPATIEDGFRPDISIMPSPWNPGRKLVRIGIKAFDTPKEKRPRANLVFLMDTSGSMYSIDRLPLAKVSVCLLLDELRPDDTISLVTYAGGVRVALAPTRAADKDKLLAALDDLQSGGSTAGASGIDLAYAQARAGFVPGGVNRVILMTDGDFNVGISDPAALKHFIAGKRASGVTLTVLGYGMGNYQDTTMQTLAEAGNGQAAYVGSLADAKKVMSRGIGAALFTVAGDTKFQVEFNPATVKEWRLVGYESRALDKTDFNNDRVDSGDVQAGQSVTVLYEIVPAGQPGDAPTLRYQAKPPAPAAASGEYAFLRIRFKLPGTTQSRLIELPIGPGFEVDTLAQAPESARFAVAVAWIAQILRQDPAVEARDRARALELAHSAIGTDKDGDRLEFVAMMKKAGI